MKTTQDAEARWPVRAVLSLLDKREKRNLFLTLCFVVVAALIEVIGVGTIGPFLAVSSSPGLIHSNSFLSQVNDFFGFDSDKAFILMLGMLVLLFLVATNLVKALARFLTIRFTSRCRHSLSVRLMEAYLSQGYVFFLHRNSHEFVKNINGEIQNMVLTTLIPAIELVSSAIQTIFFVIFLLMVDPIASFVVLLGVGVVYGSVYSLLRNKLKQLGQTKFNLNRERTRVASEVFWGIKETKLAGLEKNFLDQYSKSSASLADNESQAEAFSDIPKYVLETAAFASILSYIVFVIVETGSFAAVATVAGLYVYAGYRLIPALQTVFRSVTRIRYGAATVQLLAAELALTNQGTRILPAEEKLPFKHEIQLADLSFRYPVAPSNALSSVSLSIRKNEMVGVIGATGSGKTTLIDVLLALLDPSEGALLVDGTPITPLNKRSWQANIGYVPQAIYLSAGSIAQNIAFGVPEDEIDHARLERVSAMAQIHDFISTKLPEGYHTSIGERGVRLSGGQRQRLGIARALYAEPTVLVFDEATSALDNQTEEDLMEAVENISGQLTIIMIAHRLSTLRKCSRIFELKEGTLVR